MYTVISKDVLSHWGKDVFFFSSPMILDRNILDIYIPAALDLAVWLFELFLIFAILLDYSFNLGGSFSLNLGP